TYGRQGTLQLAVGDTQGELHWRAQGSALLVEFAGQRSTAQVHVQGDARHIFTPRGAAVLELQDPLAHAGEGHREGGRLTAPMPGKVVSFAVKAGDTVTQGQPLAVMEAMKMEHTIAAPADGVVQELLYAPGDQVAEGAELIRIETTVAA
ncbi:MAG: biotin/lipoyl-binding protein, partial [Comamonas sp.]|nr:biotin/lipoyl-binding protein [Candidatus Comamonas equi]